MNSSRDAKDSSNGKKISDMVKKYGALFYGSARLLTGMSNVHDEVDERVIGKLLDSVEFSKLLDSMKRALLDGENTAVAKSRIQHDYSNTVLEIAAAIYISDDIGETYSVNGMQKTLFDLDIDVANALIRDPRQARKAISLMNKIAINSFAISEIIKTKNGFFPEEPILSALAPEFYAKLIDEISRGEESCRNFVSSCFKMVEGNKIGYNIAIVSRSDIVNGLADDKLALNRLVGLHYIISGIERH
jgi:hypothetical protein